MTRDDGFSIADISTSLLDDPKFRALWRRLNDPAEMAQAVTLYLAVVLESWRSGERADATDAAPMWLTDTSKALEGLQAAGLLDDAGKLPERAWLGWYRPAHDRRVDRQIGGQIGGLMASLHMSADEARAEAKRRLNLRPSPPQSKANPSVLPTYLPTVPSAPSQPQGEVTSSKDRTKAWNEAHPNDQIPEVAS